MKCVFPQSVYRVYAKFSWNFNQPVHTHTHGQTWLTTCENVDMPTCARTHTYTHTHRGIGLHYRMIRQMKSCSSVGWGNMFLLPKSSRQALASTHSSSQWATEQRDFRCPRCCSAYDSTPFSSTIKNVWSSTSTPHVSSWHVQRQFYFYLTDR
jgi:hypothetical protein